MWAPFWKLLLGHIEWNSLDFFIKFQADCDRYVSHVNKSSNRPTTSNILTFFNFLLQKNYHLSPVSVIMPIANCSLALLATLNTCCIRSPPLNASKSITTLSLFVNAVTTFNYLIVHPFLETEILLWEYCIVMLFTDNSIFSSYSLCNSVLSVI